MPTEKWRLLILSMICSPPFSLWSFGLFPLSFVFFLWTRSHLIFFLAGIWWCDSHVQWGCNGHSQLRGPDGTHDLHGRIGEWLFEGPAQTRGLWPQAMGKPPFMAVLSDETTPEGPLQEGSLMLLPQEGSRSHLSYLNFLVSSLRNWWLVITVVSRQLSLYPHKTFRI